MYRIYDWLPSKNAIFSGAGFSIVLTKEWQKLFKEKGLSQEELNRIVEVYEKTILEGHNFEYNKDYPQIGVVYDEEWGINRISVPGDACGLIHAVCEPMWNAREGERELKSHNMDSVAQASMTLALFLQVANWLEIK